MFFTRVCLEKNNKHMCGPPEDPEDVEDADNEIVEDSDNEIVDDWQQFLKKIIWYSPWPSLPYLFCQWRQHNKKRTSMGEICQTEVG